MIRATLRGDPILATDAPDFVHDYANLASPAMGARAVRCSDEFFAAKERILQDAPAVFIAGKFDDNGKWMDGWETRRRRGGGNDWLLIRLGSKGVIKGVDIDTSHFTGNFPPAASIEAIASDAEPGPDAAWRTLVPTTELGPDARHYRAATLDEPVDWLRLQIYPDGGVARLRVYGLPQPDWSAQDAGGEVELSAARHGGRVLAYSDDHYGGVLRLVAPGRGVDMGDGWETRRRREPGFDWCLIQLAAPGVIERIEIDTAHFKGNFPDSCSIQAAHVPNPIRRSLITQAMFWPELLGSQKLQADHIHGFGHGAVAPLGPVTHVRLNMVPDGGISRLRLFGRLA